MTRQRKQKRQREQPPRTTPHIAVALPHRDHNVSMGFAMSFSGIRWPGPITIMGDSLPRIDQARNKLVMRALSENADCILFLDSDMHFPPDVVERLLANEKDIVTGLYRSRVAPFPWLVSRTSKPTWLTGEVPKEPFEISAAGAGCLLVKREVFLAIEPPWFECQNIFNTDRTADAVHYITDFAGEDVFFYRKAKAAGYRIFADPGVQCGHEQLFVIRPDGTIVLSEEGIS